MSKIIRSLLACLAVAGAAGAWSGAAAAHVSARGASAAAADVAEPAGDFWAPDRAPQGPVKIVISLSAQRAYVYRDGVRIGESPVSTGMPGRETPTGAFTVLEKQRFHRSNKYDDAPMPFMQRITWAGVALHAGNLPGYPASHGCIRLPQAFARKLFGVTSVGTQVVVTDDESGSPDETGAQLQGPASPDDQPDLDSAPPPEDPTP